MLAVERSGQPLARAPIGERDLVGLADIPDVDPSLEHDSSGGEALAPKLLDAFNLKGTKDLLQLGPAGPVGGTEQGPTAVLDRVGQEQPESREHSGPGGNDDAVHAQMIGHVGGMQSARPAERKQGELPRIEAALDTDDPDRFLHIGVGHVDDALGRGRHRLAQLGGQRRQGGFGAAGIDGHPAAQEEGRVDSA